MGNKMLCVGTILLTILLVAADWPQFRGVDSASLAPQTRLPVRWKDDSVFAWQASLLGRGVSSPVVVGNRVLLTATTGAQHDRLHVLSYDTASGQQNWDRQFWATGHTATDSSISPASSTPASDGKCVVALFSSNDLVCLELDGDLRWYRGLTYDHPKTANDIGMASSPIILDGIVVVQLECQGESFAAGIDIADGRTLWRVKRPRRATWCSPIALPSAVLLQSEHLISAVDVRTGAELWQLDVDCPTVPSSTFSEGQLFVPSDGLTAYRCEDPSQTPTVQWQSTRLRPGSASPVVWEGRVYTLNSSVLKCADCRSGDLVWQVRLKGRHWATPVIARGYAYCLNQDGEARIVRLGDQQAEVVCTYDFGETIHASPAIADNAMFVRCDRYLWKISDRD